MRIDVPDGALIQDVLDAVIHSFHERHRLEFGHRFEKAVVEIVMVRMRRIGLIKKLGEAPPPPESDAPRRSVTAGASFA